MPAASVPVAPDEVMAVVVAVEVATEVVAVAPQFFAVPVHAPLIVAQTVEVVAYLAPVFPDVPVAGAGIAEPVFPGEVAADVVAVAPQFFPVPGPASLVVAQAFQLVAYLAPVFPDVAVAVAGIAEPVLPGAVAAEVVHVAAQFFAVPGHSPLVITKAIQIVPNFAAVFPDIAVAPRIVPVAG